jgi:hypothetical protein
MISGERNADMYVLDVVADDIEGLEDILRMLNDKKHGWQDAWHGTFERPDVVASLSRLIRDGSVQTYSVAADHTLVKQPQGSLPHAAYDAAWFGITPRGRVRHSNWTSGSSEDG